MKGGKEIEATQREAIAIFHRLKVWPSLPLSLPRESPESPIKVVNRRSRSAYKATGKLFRDHV